jgi:hypothetical protein
MRLRVGDLVEVRSAAEILKTLDSEGRLELLPFMPEMLQYCGKRYRIWKRVHKTCDTIFYDGTREIKNVVMLKELRCDGSAHDGCQAECAIFWKEAWLKGVDNRRKPARNQVAEQGPGCSLETLHDQARRSGSLQAPSEVVYSCQATEMRQATQKLSPLKLGQYFEDLWSGNVRLSDMMKGFLIWLYNTIQRQRRGSQYPFLPGRADGKTPCVTLDLKPGELVQVRSKDEILDTVNVRLRNRGLSFDREMVRYCGGQFRVHKRVENIINEKTGKMTRVPNDCIILENVICVGSLNRFCPRSVYPYWREIWLKRVEAYQSTHQELAGEVKQ